MLLISRPQVQAWRRDPNRSPFNLVGYRMLPKDMKEILMLRAMMEMQENLIEMMDVPRDLEGLQEAAIGMMKESAEVIEELFPGSRAWRELDYEAADAEAIDVLLYLLEYFVLRGYDCNDIMGMYGRKVDIVAQRQVAKFAADKTPEVVSLGDLSRAILEGDQLIIGVSIEELDGVDEELRAMERAEEDLENLASLDTLHELDALAEHIAQDEVLSDSGWDEEEYHRRVMDEAIGPDSPGYVAGGGN